MWRRGGEGPSRNSSDRRTDSVLRNPERLTLIRTLEYEGRVGWARWAMSADGMTLASSINDNTIELRNAQTGQLRRTILAGHKIESLALSADGQILVSGGENEVIEIRDTQTGQLRRTISTGRGDNRLVISNDGQTLVSTISWLLSSIKVWDMRTGELRHCLAGASSPLLDMVGSLVLSDNGQTLVSGGQGHRDGSAGLWGAIAGLHERNIKIWDMQTGQLRHAITHEYTNGTVKVALSKDGQTLASGGSYENYVIIHIWDMQTGQLRHTLHEPQISHPLVPKYDYTVRSLVLSNDGQTLVSGCDIHECFTSKIPDEAIHIWDMRTGELRHTLADMGDIVALSANEKTLVSYGRHSSDRYGRKTIRVYGV